MLLISLAALAMGSAPVQAAPQQAPVEAAPAAPATETRQVCRFETVVGSNRRTRVCRNVPRQGVQDQATRDFMRDSQRVRTPDVG
ncbi:hypothetical protein [Brevundimonas lenta]|uniref:Uncharacterized protein n=1 Tax=Brevundimonas lenta TaxID=424796 RepID=A0A7W6JAN1_9CAUL|nr:hypothetical protein [Brevundimonas lenta]MBB4081625.1 hypothetical protein [Brevundimonas lenta]